MSFLVYTALTGNYEKLNENLPISFPNHKFICLTDNPKLKSRNWEVVLANSSMAYSSKDMSRHMKMKPYKYFGRSTATLYIDNTVNLKSDPYAFYQYLCKDSKIGLIQHSFHQSLKGELKSIAKTGRASEFDLMKWASFALSKKLDFLSMKVYWGGIIARRPSIESEIFGQKWWLEYMRSPGRDQLSLPFVIEDCSEWINIVKLNNLNSKFHQWPNSVVNSRSSNLDALSKITPSKHLTYFIETFEKNREVKVRTSILEFFSTRKSMAKYLGPVIFTLIAIYVRSYRSVDFVFSQIKRIYQIVNSTKFLLRVFFTDPKKYWKKIIKNPLRMIKIFFSTSQ